ncbi:MAG TPA: hypothetical protein VK607_14320, partial [Kofleriaceae bacterium]|nr:hypothetical protein [Kofleriaceae bacterium]
MPSIQDLLQRWGFVKLRRYGLELTSDGRILSTRPVLDDGTGKQVVGWHDSDVAIWKLSPWSGEPAPAPTPAPVPVLAPPAALPDISAGSAAVPPPA